MMKSMMKMFVFPLLLFSVFKLKSKTSAGPEDASDLDLDPSALDSVSFLKCLHRSCFCCHERCRPAWNKRPHLSPSCRKLALIG